MFHFVPSTGTRKLEKQLTDSQPDITVPKRDQTSHEGNKTELKDWVILDDLVLPECCSPKLAGFNEEGAVDTTTDTEKDKSHKFENVPVSNVSHFEKHDLISSIWVQEF